MRLFTLVIASGLVFPVHAQSAAYYISGNELIRACEGDSTLCLGYVTGVSDGVTWLHPKAFCVPDEVKNTQLVRVVTRYLQENPKTLHRAAQILVSDALRRAWPCRK